MRLFVWKSMVFLVLVSSFPVYAATVAYWKADEGTADTLIYTEYDDYRYSQDIDDVSGNGNHLQAWSDTPNNSSFWHRGNIPFSMVPQTSQMNKLSIKNYGTKPGINTQSTADAYSVYGSNPTGIDAELIEPAQFTVEALFNPDSSQDPSNAGKVGTLVCRDAYQYCTADPSASSFALRVHDADSDTAAWSIESFFVDVSLIKHSVQSAANVIEAGKWYHVAAVSDGTTFTVYLTNITDGGDTEVIASVDMTLSGSPDTALGADDDIYSTWHGGGWVLYRELVNKGHFNRYQGYLDEVRILDTALSPIDFLCNVGRSASNPMPKDSATEVGISTGTYTVTVNLGWDKGLTVDPGDPNSTIPNPNVLKYYVYRSEDQNVSSDPALYYREEIPANGDTGAATASLNKDGKYFWRIDEALDKGGGVPSGIDDPNTITGYVWSFETKLSNFPPDVDAGDTVYTWLTEGAVDVQMAPTITDDGVPGPYTVLWEEAPEDPNVVINSPTAEATTVTIDQVGSYTLMLTVNDGELEASDAVTIQVYADPCEAAKGVPGYTPLSGDINDDCSFDLADLSILVVDWLESTALTEPLP